MYKARDVKWITSKKTGAIPYIFNHENSKIKLIIDNTILDIEHNDKAGNLYNDAKDAIANHYNIEDYIFTKSTTDIISSHLNIFQLIIYFNAQDLWDYDAIINKFQILRIKQIYDSGVKKEEKRKQKAQKRKQEIEEKTEKEKEF